MTHDTFRTVRRTVASLSLVALLAGAAACQRSTPAADPNAAASAQTPAAPVAAPAVPSPAAPAVPSAPAAPDPNQLAAVPSPGAAAGAPGPVRASCNRSSTGQCTDYTARSFEGRATMGVNEDTLRTNCGESSGTWATTACPTANVVGTCTTTEGDLVRYYSTGRAHYNAARAGANCADPVGGYAGTWAAATP